MTMMTSRHSTLRALALLALLSAACSTTEPTRTQDASDDAREAGPVCGVCGGETPYCDEAAEACVACLESAQCSDSNTSRCEAGACVACEVDADCGHQDGLPRCANGTCRACTTETEAADCGLNACHTETGTCGSVARGSQGSCEPCGADSECFSDASGTRRCVALAYQDAAHGSYCLLDKATTVGAECPRRFPDVETTTSLGGTLATYCSIRTAITTCEAVTAFQESCTEDTDCGDPALGDGLCRESGGGKKCTYACQGTDDCASGAACSSADPKYCCTGSAGPGCD